MAKCVRAFLVATAFLFAACSNQDTGPSAGVGVVSGFVKDAGNRSPLAGVIVEGRVGAQNPVTATTDAQGRYELRFDLDSATTAKISIRNYTGYRDTLDIVVTVRPNEATLKDIDLTAKSQVVGSGGSSSGLAQTIAFLGANPTQVSVYGVGGQETAVLGFEARDSLGLPIDAAHAVQIQFALQGGPNGGEYISPTVLTTNGVGRAYVAFNSGTRSGVVQVLASATVGTRTITSSPVRVVINAGFPDQAHFTIAPEKLNFPTLGVAGNRNRMLVIVGDRYSNPVIAGTAVYFSSSAGVIQASVFTNNDGQGTVDLISGNPAPFGQYAAQQGDGYHYVVARTIGEGGAVVRDSVLILWSGRSQISNITPASFTIPNAGYQDFTFTVSDYLGHPLAAGTTISVVATVPPPPDPNAQVNQVQLAFGRNGQVVLEDIVLPGPGRTEFGFRLSDGTPNPNVLPSAVSISISVEGPNGNAYATINGTCN
ncbi:MAG: hypothetical protein C4326_01100 [Ignavibacteria bacterium]